MTAAEIARMERLAEGQHMTPEKAEAGTKALRAVLAEVQGHVGRGLGPLVRLTPEAHRGLVHALDCLQAWARLSDVVVRLEQADAELAELRRRADEDRAGWRVVLDGDDPDLK